MPWTDPYLVRLRSEVQGDKRYTRRRLPDDCYVHAPREYNYGDKTDARNAAAQNSKAWVRRATTYTEETKAQA